MSAIRIGVAALLSLMLGNAVQAQEHMVFLLRHAEKASEPPADPPLSATGEQRAGILAIRLANANPAAIFTSQYQRTQLTAKPLAETVGIGITVVPIDKANAGEYPQQLRERVCAMPANSNTVIIGHSNTIPAIAAAWTAEPVRPIADDEYNRVLIIKLKDCQVTGWLDLRY